MTPPEYLAAVDGAVIRLSQPSGYACHAGHRLDALRALLRSAPPEVPRGLLVWCGGLLSATDDPACVAAAMRATCGNSSTSSGAERASATAAAAFRSEADDSRP